MKDSSPYNWAGVDSVTITDPWIMTGGKQYSETLKLSNCTNVQVNNVLVKGSLEDCIDIVRGGNIKFSFCAFHPYDYTKQVATIKGGASMVSFYDCIGIGRKNKVVIGQYSDYDKDADLWAENISFHDCQNLQIEVWKGRNIELLNCHNCEIKYIPKIIVWAYFAFRRIQQKLGLK